MYKLCSMIAISCSLMTPDKGIFEDASKLWIFQLPISPSWANMVFSHVEDSCGGTLIIQYLVLTG